MKRSLKKDYPEIIFYIINYFMELLRRKNSRYFIRDGGENVSHFRNPII